jgi:putative SOS response-associated peptidase YedK
VDIRDTWLPPPGYKIAPSQPVLAFAAGPNGPTARLMRWGFRPHWMTDAKRSPPINARAEPLDGEQLKSLKDELMGALGEEGG